MQSKAPEWLQVHYLWDGGQSSFPPLQSGQIFPPLTECQSKILLTPVALACRYLVSFQLRSQLVQPLPILSKLALEKKVNYCSTNNTPNDRFFLCTYASLFIIRSAKVIDADMNFFLRIRRQFLTFLFCE